MNRLFSLVLLFCVLLSGCSNPSSKVQAISFVNPEETLLVGDETQIAIEITPDNISESQAIITWESSDENIVSVSDGVMSGVGVGEAIITATSKNGKAASCTVTVKSVYDSLTSTDKRFYNDFLLYVMNGVSNPDTIEISSIRESDDSDDLYWVAFTHVNDEGDSEELYYAYVYEYRLFAPVTFDKNPAKWDWAEISNYNLDGINKALKAYCKESEAIICNATDMTEADLKKDFLDCRTFYFSDGDIFDEHAITRVDLEQGTFRFLSYTSNGIKNSDVKLDYEKDGFYSVDIDSDGNAYINLDGQEKCRILFDDSGKISGIFATGYINYGGDVAITLLQLTDMWS